MSSVRARTEPFYKVHGMQWTGRHLRALRAVSLPSWICQRLYKRFNTSHTFGSVRFLYAGTAATDTQKHIKTHTSNPAKR
jgi:hypothetical protein